MIKVTCESRDYSDREDRFAGKTIEQVYDLAKPLLDIPAKDRIKVQDAAGNELRWNDSVRSGDEIEFVVPERSKGN